MKSFILPNDISFPVDVGRDATEKHKIHLLYDNKCPPWNICTRRIILSVSHSMVINHVFLICTPLFCALNYCPHSTHMLVLSAKISMQTCNFCTPKIVIMLVFILVLTMEYTISLFARLNYNSVPILGGKKQRIHICFCFSYQTYLPVSQDTKNFTIREFFCCSTSFSQLVNFKPS